MNLLLFLSLASSNPAASFCRNAECGLENFFNTKVSLEFEVNESYEENQKTKNKETNPRKQYLEFGSSPSDIRIRLYYQYLL